MNREENRTGDSDIIQPSETALITASLRALAAHDGREEIRCNDYLAEIFLPDERKRPLTDPGIRESVMKLIPAGMYEYIIARTAYFDSIVEKSLREDIPQIVYLGAGYDSRPYRFAKITGATRIYELDAGPTQERKIALLKQANVPIPSDLKFVAADFTNDNLAKVLAQAGYDNGQRTLFIWEGVTFYLSAQDIDDVLSFIVDKSPFQSEVCFDFHTQPSALAGEKGELQTDIPTERIKFRGIAEGMLGTFLADRGLRLIEHFTAKNMEANYLKLKDGSIIGHIDPKMNFAYAKVIGC